MEVKINPPPRGGSRMRCLLLTHAHGSKDWRTTVSLRLTQLINLPFVEVTADDHWAPQGFDNPAEPLLSVKNCFISESLSSELRRWWLARDHVKANEPNWDIASTCRINKKKGLLLIEAKAHSQELINEEAGKKLKGKPTLNSCANHEQIGKRITEASDYLKTEINGDWKLSRDDHYQMSNRFTWAWRLTAEKIPVILVYLGFLNAREMVHPFTTTDEWEKAVKVHSCGLVPNGVWNHKHVLNDVDFIPLIRSVEFKL